MEFTLSGGEILRGARPERYKILRRDKSWLRMTEIEGLAITTKRGGIRDAPLAIIA